MMTLGTKIFNIFMPYADTVVVFVFVVVVVVKTSLLSAFCRQMGFLFFFNIIFTAADAYHINFETAQGLSDWYLDFFKHTQSHTHTLTHTHTVSLPDTHTHTLTEREKKNLTKLQRKK